MDLSESLERVWTHANVVPGLRNTQAQLRHLGSTPPSFAHNSICIMHANN